MPWFALKLFGLPRWVWAILAVAVLFAAFYAALDAYGDSRFREGRTVEEQAWKDAEAEMLRKADVAAEDADNAALARALEYSAQVADEKEKIDAAIADGTSPLDVLFPSDGVRAAEDN